MMRFPVEHRFWKILGYPDSVIDIDRTCCSAKDFCSLFAGLENLGGRVRPSADIDLASVIRPLSTLCYSASVAIRCSIHHDALEMRVGDEHGTEAGGKPDVVDL
jgi:hypothetical protein